jgi:hypothetical protein
VEAYAFHVLLETLSKKAHYSGSSFFNGTEENSVYAVCGLFPVFNRFTNQWQSFESCRRLKGASWPCISGAVFWQVQVW